MSECSLSLFSALAVQASLDDVVLPSFLAESGVTLDITYEPTTVLVGLIRDGARPDVIIAVTESVQSLIEAGVVAGGSSVPIAKAGIGVASAGGAAPVDITTVDALKQTLLHARSVAYSRAGASGIYFAELIHRLGISDELNSRATIVEKGFTAEALNDGRADLAIQQVSELRFIKGVDVLGPLPDAVQCYTEFSVALGAAAVGKQEAQSFVRHVTSASANSAYAAAGLQRP